MVELPYKLINSLTELGLLESEAKIYAALVYMQSAEVRDLLEFLEISKPSIYEGLRMLEKNGLIVLTSPRPAMYQAIEPKIALEIILKKYEESKKEALIELENFKNQEMSIKPQQPSWFIFGAKSFEFKIKDMLKNAKETIYCQTSIKYLHYIERAARKNIQIYLVVMSADKDNERLKRLSQMNNVELNIIETDEMEATNEKNKEELEQRYKESINDLMDLENQIMLVVDDAEFLTVPPFKSDSLTALTSTNKALIFTSKLNIEKALLIYESGKK